MCGVGSAAPHRVPLTALPPQTPTCGTSLPTAMCFGYRLNPPCPEHRQHESIDLPLTPKTSILDVLLQDQCDIYSLQHVFLTLKLWICNTTLEQLIHLSNLLFQTPQPHRSLPLISATHNLSTPNLGSNASFSFCLVLS